MTCKSCKAPLTPRDVASGYGSFCEDCWAACGTAEAHGPRAAPPPRDRVNEITRGLPYDMGSSNGRRVNRKREE